MGSIWRTATHLLFPQFCHITLASEPAKRKIHRQVPPNGQGKDNSAQLPLAAVTEELDELHSADTARVFQLGQHRAGLCGRFLGRLALFIHARAGADSAELVYQTRVSFVAITLPHQSLRLSQIVLCRAKIGFQL